MFPAVELAQVIRWTKSGYCYHLVLMTVFAHDQWLNISFISLWPSLTPTGQDNQLIKHLLPQSCFLCFIISFLLIALFLFHFFFFQFVFLLCFNAAIPHLSQFLSFHLIEAKGRQHHAITSMDYVTVTVVPWLFAVLQPPSGIRSVLLDFLLERLASRHKFVQAHTPNPN